MHRLQQYIGPAVDSICSSMLQLPIDECPSRGDDRTAGYVGCVHLVGDEPAAVVIHCQAPFAHCLATAMFGSKTVSDADMRDAVGEMTNIVAGNLKAALPEPHMLSLPSVIEGRHFTAHVLNGEQVARRDFISDAGSFAVSVYAERSAT